MVIFECFLLLASSWVLNGVYSMVMQLISVLEVFPVKSGLRSQHLSICQHCPYKIIVLNLKTWQESHKLVFFPQELVQN